MLSLNLVSEKLKQDIKLRRIYQLFKKINYVLIIVTAAIATILLMARLILQINFNKVVSETTLVTRNSQNYITKVRKINSQIKSIAQIQENFIAWSYLIEKLAVKTPPGITLSLVNINKDQAAINIRGHANTREDLLLLNQNLENSKIFINIQFPIKNILEKENINFEIDTELDLSAING